MIIEPRRTHKRKRIGILTFPIGDAGLIPLASLVDLLSRVSEEVCLISGPEAVTHFKDDARVRSAGVYHTSGATLFSRILRYVRTQTQLAIKLAEMSKNVDIWVFFIGGDLLILPLLVAKMLCHSVVLVLAGSASLTLLSANDELSRPTQLISEVNCSLADRIVVYSKSLVREWHLEKYQEKTLVARHNLVDFSKFKVARSFGSRGMRVGFIGRMGYEKGVLEFAMAVPKLMTQRQDLRFTIVGEGVLRKKLEEFIVESNLQGIIDLKGWVAHDEIPYYLNSFKLLVIPSLTEGLPNILVESMACGTPVLATPVGAVRDVIIDGYTGFIMKDNSPDCVARNVIRCLDYEDLESVSRNARAYVEEEFANETILKMWQEMFRGD